MWNELKNREEAGRIKEDAFNNFNPLMKIISRRKYTNPFIRTAGM